MSTGREHDEMLAAAREEAQRMIETVASADAEKNVTMKVAQFRKLAQLIEGLAGAASREGGFDAPIDGVRFWVPLPYLATERARFARMLAAQPAPPAGDRFAF